MYAIQSTKFRRSLIWGCLALVLACLSGCIEKKAVDFDRILATISKMDPNEASALTAKLFSEQQKRELAEIKVRSETKSVERQENVKLACVLGMGGAVVAFIAGLWFGRKLIIGLAIAGFLGCLASWGLIFASLQHGVLIGWIAVSFCLVLGASLFIAFVWTAFKHKKALIQVVMGNEYYKAHPGDTGTLAKLGKNFGLCQKELQTKTTEKIVDKIRNGDSK